MAQITSGLRAILSLPLTYNILQNLMGAARCRKEFADRHVRAKVGERVLDIGCGTAQLLHYLPEGISYTGYDPSTAYIDSARTRYAARGQFHHGIFDANTAAQQAPFDCAIASGVLHHMNDAEATDMISLVRQSLVPGGRLITIDPVYCAGQNPLAKWLIDHDRGLNVRNGNDYAALAAPHFTTVTTRLAHRAWPPYTHWIMECTA